VAVGGEHVEAAVEIGVEKEEAKLQGLAGDRADAGGDGIIAEVQGAAFADVEGAHFVGKIAHGDGEGAVIAEISGIYTHSATSLAGCVKSHARHGADFLEFAVAFVVEDEILNGIVGDDEVDQAVAIDVDGANARLWPGLLVARFFTCTPDQRSHR
jgi:hypothetical protein